MRMRFMFILFLCLLPLGLKAQDLLPPIYNYKIFEYNADGKNWGLSLNEDGELFVANNKGLLYYNGEQWVLNKLPNNTTIRSVASIGNKIYTGSYEEFGFWEKNDIGLLEYTSLTHLIKDHEFTSEEFWQILPYGDSIVFRSFAAIYIYKNDGITVLDPTFVVTGIVVYDDKLLVADHQGLFWLRENDFPQLKNIPLIEGKIVDMIALDTGLLIGTKLNGCYLLKNDELAPWNETINEELKSHQLNKILKLSTGKIAFGTIKNGIYLFDSEKKTSERLNRKTGLQNNTVLSMAEYKGQLWMGLDNGIDRVRLNAPITYYTDYSGTVGTVYDMAIFSGVLYLGSNTGIYYLKDNELQFIQGSQGHVWDLEVLDGSLIYGHNTGTFKIENERLEKISDVAGGYQITNLPREKDVYLQGTYVGISKFLKKDNNSWVVNSVQNINFPVKQLCFENPTSLWAAHPYKGLHRMTINNTHDSILSMREFNTDHIPNNYNIKVYNVKSQIVIQSEGVWYKYDPILDKIVVLQEFSVFNNKKLLHHDEKYFWFIDDGDAKNMLYTDLKNDSLVIAEPEMRKRSVPDAENMVKLNDSIYFFTLSDGFGKINLFKLNRHLKNLKIPTPKLGFFKDKGKLYPLGEAGLLELPFKTSRDITLQVASPSLIHPKYYYRLTGSENRSSYINNGTINFQNLPYGNYELEVSTVGMDNGKSLPLKIAFYISPPWYLSKASMMGYFLGLLGLVFLVRLYNKKKLEKKHEILKAVMQREHEERLTNIEKEKLAKEIKHKQKELANTTLNIAKKNEVLLELKSMLLINQDNFSNKQRFRSFVKKLDTSIKGDEDWKRFEMNFKELHDDFFESLLNKFPDLTPKDLKLAAYLKMNLSSKEIAPLMAITTRGVEIHRYRLRKKLGLDGSQNISKFLITFK